MPVLSNLRCHFLSLNYWKCQAVIKLPIYSFVMECNWHPLQSQSLTKCVLISSQLQVDFPYSTMFLITNFRVVWNDAIWNDVMRVWQFSFLLFVIKSLAERWSEKPVKIAPPSFGNQERMKIVTVMKIVSQTLPNSFLWNSCNIGKLWFLSRN